MKGLEMLPQCSRRIDFYAVQTEKLAYFYVKYESDWLTNFNFGILLRKEEISAVSINGQIDLVLKAELLLANLNDCCGVLCHLF
ncbi:hypothetical protein T03_11232 [Trichinella britovi]|uniref:Uncharacterized protein n=1 Tax=Trichinella britovi TaxID=45882 RepID=A0A0V1DDN1_TRIBR|nr:hypothetical protein T03_11232 [Trichinella britovi]